MCTITSKAAILFPYNGNIPPFLLLALFPLQRHDSGRDQYFITLSTQDEPAHIIGASASSSSGITLTAEGHRVEVGGGGGRGRVGTVHLRECGDTCVAVGDGEALEVQDEGVAGRDPFHILLLVVEGLLNGSGREKENISYCNLARVASPPPPPPRVFILISSHHSFCMYSCISPTHLPSPTPCSHPSPLTCTLSSL